MPRVVTLTDRPDMKIAFGELDSEWPEFMKQDPAGWGYDAMAEVYPEYQLVLLDDSDAVMGTGHCCPVPWSNIPDDLPDQGWDEAIGRSMHAHLSGRPTPTACAIEISVLPRLRGTGLSSLIVKGMVANADRLGHADLVAPVRPSAKAAEPETAMGEFAFRVRDDGLPFDPWLRVHVRLGGEIIKVCPAAMSIAGSLRQWREWTQLPFDEDGDIVVPGALAPIHVSLTQDHAVYVEPNVWVRHRIGKR